MEMLKITYQSQETFKNWTLNKYVIICPLSVPTFLKLGGCDPGSVNLGLSVLFVDAYGNEKAVLWQIKLERFKDPIERLLLYNEIYAHFYATLRPELLVIENAAYAQGFRATELAEQRALFAWKSIECLGGQKVKMVVPNSIRKIVFGDGRTKAHEVWQLDGLLKKDQPNDALAALACAYYGGMNND